MTDKPIKLAINGAAGRMGQRLISLAGEDKAFEVVCAIEDSAHPYIGKKLGGVTYADRLSRGADVVIDFSLPKGTEAVLAAAVNDETAMVIGTTGLGQAAEKMIRQAVGRIPIVQAANFCIGVNLLLKLAAQAAGILGEGFDIEIVEAHHRFKKDAPSGTALALARAIGEARGEGHASALRQGRSGQCPREAGEIGVHAVRLGDTVGEHAVHFGSLGETVSLSHSAHTRDTFAGGALRAAAWVVDKSPGLYSMADVLFGAEQNG